MVWIGDRPGQRPGNDVDVDEDNSLDLDYGSLFCPNPSCGCNSIEILQMPKSGRSWFGGGRGRCRFCGCEFTIALELEEEEG